MTERDLREQLVGHARRMLAAGPHVAVHRAWPVLG
jgi:hypothetical protein